MITESLIEIFGRDLNLLRKEISEYQDESRLWVIDKEINNSGGNLCLHLTGNLNHFIGAILGKTGYERNRPLEFSDNNVPRSKLLEDIDSTNLMIKEILNTLSSDDLAQTYPIEVFDKPMTVEFFLIHLATHLNYHLGQVNYHRRLLG